MTKQRKVIFPHLKANYSNQLNLEAIFLVMSDPSMSEL
jgi:hypothetical protein